jgi:hypothetical protein
MPKSGQTTKNAKHQLILAKLQGQKVASPFKNHKQQLIFAQSCNA